MVSKPTSEAAPQAAEQLPAEGILPDVTAGGAEAPAAAVQEKDVLADLADEKLREHPRIKGLLEESQRSARDDIEQRIGKERRRIAKEERDAAATRVERERGQMREQILMQIAGEEDPDRRQQLRAHLGMQQEIDEAERRGIQRALDQWHAEGRLHLTESGLVPTDAREAAELRVRVMEKYGERATYFDQMNELMAYWKEQYVPKSDLDRLVAEKAQALRVSESGREITETRAPTELPPTGGTVSDYAEACHLFNTNQISAERFKELRRQFGIE